MAERILRIALCLALAASLAAAAGFPSSPAGAGVPSGLGTLAGLVADSRGVPQMGAAVVLLAGDGRILHRLFTNDRGVFLLDRLTPGHYGLRVTLANFLPVVRENVTVEAGGRAFLSINLASLSDALAGLSGAPRPRPESDEDWKWVVRSSGATRPILRWLPGHDVRFDPVLASASWKKPEYRARLEFSGGSGRSGGFGSEADFSTGFGFTQNLFSDTTLLLGGSLGYERSSPVTAFRGVLRRQRPNGTSPDISVTVRQIFLPGASLAQGARLGRDGQSNSIALGFEDSAVLGQFVRLEYGVMYDSISFLNHLNTLSPYGRAILEVAPGTSLQAIYAEGLPRERPMITASGNDPLSEVVSQLSLYPRISQRGGAPGVQQGRHMETAVEHKFTPRTRFRLAAFRDDVSNLAVGAAPNGMEISSDDFLPEFFNQNYSYNGGSHHLTGVRLAYQQPLGDNLQATAVYSYSGLLGPEQRSLFFASLNDLREILRIQHRHALAMKLGANVPLTKTRILASYKWISGTPVLAGDLYDDSFGRADNNLNLVIRQPLPAMPLVAFTSRMEARADFRNLLAQGYVPISTADGKRLILLQNVRSFRGGLSFNF